MNIIEKDNPNRWFYIKKSGTKEESLIVFGNVGEQGKTEIETSDANTLEAYLTEDELEVKINEIAEVEDYYKDSVEQGSLKFQMPSDKYQSPEIE